MSAFSVTPLTDVPPPQAADFPDFIQFQDDGTDLGLADADTLNFSTGLRATRGVGENSNVITVTGAAPSVLKLTSLPDPPLEGIYFFDGTLFDYGWAGAETQVASEHWQWDTLTNVLTFISSGLYQVIVSSYIEASNQWPAGATTYGSQIGDPLGEGSIGVQARSHTLDDPSDTAVRMNWTDQHMLNVSADATSMAVGIYALATDVSHPVLFAGMHMTITRLGDAV